MSDTAAPPKAIVELAIQSRDMTDAAFDALLPEVAKYASSMANPQSAMGVVQALMRIATALAYSTIGTPLDVRVRTPEEMALLGAAHWRAACHLNSLVLAELKRQGHKVPAELQRAVNAAPPDGDPQVASEAASAPPLQPLAEKIVAVTAGEDDEATAKEKAEAKSESQMVADLMRINSRGGNS